MTKEFALAKKALKEIDVPDANLDFLDSQIAFLKLVRHKRTLIFKKKIVLFELF